MSPRRTRAASSFTFMHLLDDIHTGAPDAIRRKPGPFHPLKLLLDDFLSETPNTPARGGDFP